MIEGIHTISVIGAGYMGRQIIEKSALSGYNIHVFDLSSEGLEEFFDDVKKKTDEENINIVIERRNIDIGTLSKESILEKIGKEF